MSRRSGHDLPHRDLHDRLYTASGFRAEGRCRLAQGKTRQKNGTPPIFRLFGYAGTGKTTLARHIADGVDGEVKFAAFTGKAALVMRNKGCDNASTIHSLIYRARESGVEQPSFELWDDAPASKAKLIVIDECSMVDAELGRDLMSFECPLLVLGDPAQLPPIQGGGYFTDCEPDAMLTEVHRQARNDPIVRMSMDIREGRELKIGRYGESEVVARAELDPDRVMRADQVLGRTRQYAALLRRADAAKAAHRGSIAGSRRQAGLPAQQPQEGPVQWRAVAGEVARAVEIENHHHAAVAGRRFRIEGDKGLGPRRVFWRRDRDHPVGTAQAL